jgi:hypothetical protein
LFWKVRAQRVDLWPARCFSGADGGHNADIDPREVFTSHGGGRVDDGDHHTTRASAQFATCIASR